jgi:hypothetical protein
VAGWPLEMGRGVRVKNYVCSMYMSFPRRSNPVKKLVFTCQGQVKWFREVALESTIVVIYSS